MARKGILSKGTEFWILHGTAPAFTQLHCLNTWDWGDENYDEIDDDCLDNPDVGTSQFVLGKPADGSVMINTDAKNATHLLLLDLANSQEQVVVYTGYPDGTGVPTITNGDIDLPPTRSWTYATVSFRKGKPVLDKAALVNHTLPLRRQSQIIDEWMTGP